MDTASGSISYVKRVFDAVESKEEVKMMCIRAAERDSGMMVFGC